MKLLIQAVSIAALLVLAVQSADGQEANYSRKGADTCIACHGDAEVLTLFRTKHGAPSLPGGPFGEGQLQCEACHGPGGSHAGRVRRGQERPSVIIFGSESNTSIEEQNGMCLTCHKNNVGFSWHTGAHPSDEVACADCHNLHHSPLDAVRQTSTQADVCFACHQMQRSETQKAFSHPILEGKMGCLGCHNMHGDNAATQLARLSVNDTCQQCHAEKRGPYLWEHAPVSEDCGLCHAPHGSNHPGMLTKRAPLLCQGCHSQSGHPSVAHDADGLASGTQSRFLLGQSCTNCHSQVHGSNHPSGSKLMR
ncbi:MAG: DmsE family decaheme c-type cytochrome [Gammaproteobacteria bacterium]|nr:DmsE family decaheme c-type cytochrome [Gammaproteobacteria bacterium]MDH3428476.1 DmsE family decaheme c-type cytochrome [Gammaproteobacteria bacterium]